MDTAGAFRQNFSEDHKKRMNNLKDSQYLQKGSMNSKDTPGATVNVAAGHISTIKQQTVCTEMQGEDAIGRCLGHWLHCTHARLKGVKG